MLIIEMIMIMIFMKMEINNNKKIFNKYVNKIL
jgi:hypothetical protein